MGLLDGLGADRRDHLDAGKCVVTTRLHRLLARRGAEVAQFKAQNMSTTRWSLAPLTARGHVTWEAS